GDENRTRDGSLGSFCFTTKLHPQYIREYNAFYSIKQLFLPDNKIDILTNTDYPYANCLFYIFCYMVDTQIYALDNQSKKSNSDRGE
ncbi:hypothetical protein, partial [Enterococcus avium]